MIAFSDFHGSDAAFSKAIDTILKNKPEFLMIAGDIADNSFEKARDFLSNLNRLGIKVFYVPGNMDSIRLMNEDLRLEYVKNVHKRIVDYEGFKIVGFGGSSKTPFNTPIEFIEAEIEDFLSNLSFSEGDKVIFLTHSPPKNTKVDETFMKIHAGSIAIRRFIEEAKPLLTVCGHIHEAYGVDRLGDSPVVNVGSARKGRYGFIDMKDGFSVKLLEF
ncbi:MAG: metallophosphoesterase [Candidatus Bathyarchaeia archaeon]